MTTQALAKTAGRQTLLAEFLRARRGALKPEDVGLPKRSGRRVTGLRREEVAVLADVGTTWYTWLEQGRPIRIAPATLGRIADALQLNRHERAYLRTLILGNASPPAWNIPLPDNVAELVRTFPTPAVAIGPRWDILACNASWENKFRFPNATGKNGVRHAFLRTDATDVYADWPRQAQIVVAQFRICYARHVGDPAFESLVAELIDKSALFASLWTQSNVLTPTDLPTTTMWDGRRCKVDDTFTSLFIPDCPEAVIWFLLP